MASLILRRLLATVPVVLVVAVLVFLMVRLAPGDPAAVIAGVSANAGQIAAVRDKLGLDAPVAVQFARWAGAVLRGDFGESFFFKKPVTTLITERAGPTASLSIVTIALSALVAVPLGVAAAHRRGSLVDRSVMGFAVFGFSIPVFVFGYGLIYVFSLRLGWLPVQGYSPLAAGIGEWAKRVTLPSAALSVVFIALIVRIARASVVEVLGEDYIRTARAKGQVEAKILFRHALKNAAAPIVTVVGLGFAVLIGGVVVTESVFTIPGLGRLTVDAVLGRDYPTIQAVVLLFSSLYVAINLCVDLAHIVLDPRVRR